MSSSKQYDVFISYSSDDFDWVINRLVPKLEAHKYTIIVDYRDFITGALSVDEMQRAVEDSKRVILVLTPNYLKSEWTKFENVMAQTSDPGATNRKIVPIVLAKCDIPLRLKILVHRNLINDDPLQWDLLIRDLI